MGILLLCGNRWRVKRKKAQKMLKELQDVCESVRVAGTYKKEGK